MYLIRKRLNEFSVRYLWRFCLPKGDQCCLNKLSSLEIASLYIYLYGFSWIITKEHIVSSKGRQLCLFAHSAVYYWISLPLNSRKNSVPWYRPTASNISQHRAIDFHPYMACLVSDTNTPTFLSVFIHFAVLLCVIGRVRPVGITGSTVEPVSAASQLGRCVRVLTPTVLSYIFPKKFLLLSHARIVMIL